MPVWIETIFISGCLAMASLKAVDAVDHRLDQRIVDDRDIALATKLFSHQFASLDTASIVISTDVGGDGRAFDRDIDGDDLDAGSLCAHDGSQSTLAVDRRHDDDIDALDDEVFDVGQLLVQVLVGDRNFERTFLAFASAVIALASSL
jgi:hypothetical protein